MLMRSRNALWVGLLITTFPVSGGAQSYSCLPDTAEDVRLLRGYVVALVTGTDSGTVTLRRLYQLPTVLEPSR